MSNTFDMSSLFSKLFPPPHNFLTPLEFTCCLGQGSFGVVLKAIDKSETATAVKFLFPTEATAKEQQQTLRECQLAVDCDHVNVVKTIKVATAKLSASDVENIFKNMVGNENCNALRYAYVGKATLLKTVEAVCIQMELCGENLRQWLGQGLDGNEGIVQWKQINILRNIIAGMKYIHDKKIIHRDLKPENVMFSKVGYQLPVKIGDFGLCRKIQSEGSTLTSRMGTADYMAPEMFGNSYSLQADLYSLGLVIWEVVQLIHYGERKKMFDRLVNDKEEEVVEEHPHMAGVREVIIGLAKKKSNDRTQSVDYVMETVESWDHFHLTGSEFTAKNGDELKFCLENVDNGGTIKLINCEYVGVFHLKQDNVKVCGVEGSVLKLLGGTWTTCLTIVGCGCSLSNVAIVTGRQRTGVKLLGPKNEIRNVKFMGSLYSLDVTGDKNHLQNLNISNADNGIRIFSCKNTVEGVEIESVGRGIYVAEKSNDNSLSNISGRNVKQGIMVKGSHNQISNVDLIKNNTEREFWGVSFYWFHSKKNRIKNLTCSGYERNKNDCGMFIDSEFCSVENSECGPVKITGRFATLTNIDCGELIKVDSDAVVSLIKCRGKKLEASKKVTLADCNFDKTNFSLN